MGRKILPWRRYGVTTAIGRGRTQTLIGQAKLEYFVYITRFDDGSPAEVFVSCERPTSPMADIARDASVILSIALQYGVPVDELRRAITRLSDDSAASIMGEVLDLLALPPDPEELPEAPQPVDPPEDPDPPLPPAGAGAIVPELVEQSV